MFYFTGKFALPEVLFLNTVGQFLDACLFIYLVNHFFPIRRQNNPSRFQGLIMTVLMTAILFLVDFFFHNAFYPYYIAVIVLPLLYSILFFRGKLGDKITICFLFTTLILCLENIVICLAKMWNIGVETNYPLYLLLFFTQRVSLKIALFYISKKLILWPVETNIQLPPLSWPLFLTVSAGDTLMFVIYRLPARIDDRIAQVVSALFLCVLPYFLLIIVKYIATAADKNKLASMQISQAKMQNQYLLQQQEMAESLRKFRHDYKSHLFCMDTLLTAGKYEELHEYLVSLHQYQYEGIHLRSFVEDPSLNIILNQKVTIAEKYGIRFETDIVLPSVGKISISDLNSLLVNLCDNAIEACATLPNAVISLAIHKIKAYLMLEITNTCATDVQKTNPKFLTSKSNPEFHGMGIKIIKSIAEKYHGQYEISSSENSFTTNLMLLDE